MEILPILVPGLLSAVFLWFYMFSIPEMQRGKRVAVMVLAVICMLVLGFTLSAALSIGILMAIFQVQGYGSGLALLVVFPVVAFFCFPILVSAVSAARRRSLGRKQDVPAVTYTQASESP